MKTKPKKRYRYVKFDDTDCPDGCWECDAVDGDYKGVGLGSIWWFPRLKRWVFTPDECLDFTVQHLADILDFMRQLKKPEKRT